MKEDGCLISLASLYPFCQWLDLGGERGWRGRSLMQVGLVTSLIRQLCVIRITWYLRYSNTIYKKNLLLGKWEVKGLWTLPFITLLELQRIRTPFQTMIFLQQHRIGNMFLSFSFILSSLSNDAKETIGYHNQLYYQEMIFDNNIHTFKGPLRNKWNSVLI